MNNIKKDDAVVVLTGKDKGKHAKVLRIFPALNKALVEGINLVKKNIKPNPQAGTQGGIVTREALIQLSNLALYNPVSKKADRVGIKVLADGRKVRYFKSNNELVDIE